MRFIPARVNSETKVCKCQRRENFRYVLGDFRESTDSSFLLEERLLSGFDIIRFWLVLHPEGLGWRPNGGGSLSFGVKRTCWNMVRCRWRLPSELAAIHPSIGWLQWKVPSDWLSFMLPGARLARASGRIHGDQQSTGKKRLTRRTVDNFVVSAGQN